MDFLRRLAPPRDTDATRAVAVRPSLFASDTPLRAVPAQTRPDEHPDNDETADLFDTSASNRSEVLVAPHHPAPGVQPAPEPSGMADRQPTHRNNAAATVPVRAATRAPDAQAAEAGILLPDRHRAPLERFKRPGPEQPGSTATLAANPVVRGAAAPPTQFRAALPLSDNFLAQRTLQSREDNQVVHVTIGRIDVIASQAPAPTVPHAPAPRQATVTLADYLRGDKGGRR